jgi:FMN phosphatase YigB (HAD superfamily)
VIAAVLFDLYETLVSERESAPVRASGLGERLGLDERAFRKAWKRQRVRIILGQISFADGLREVGEMLGRTLDAGLVRRISIERRIEKSSLFQRFDPAALRVLRELRDRGIRLGVVSNCFAEDVEAWATCPAAVWFDTSVFSFEIGCAKPESRIYLEAVGRLGVEGFNALFIGDGADDELLGAERAGLGAAQAAWFCGEGGSLPPRIPRLSSWAAVLELAATR